MFRARPRVPPTFSFARLCYIWHRNGTGGILMALTMLDKVAGGKGHVAVAGRHRRRFRARSENPNPCVGSTLLSENERTRVWIIRLAPGERIGFHRHVLDYFWTSVSAAAAGNMCMTAPPWNIPTSPARPATRPTARASTRCTIWKISAIGNGVHDRRVQRQRQRADAAAGDRARAGGRLSYPVKLSAHRSGPPSGGVVYVAGGPVWPITQVG